MEPEEVTCLACGAATAIGAGCAQCGHEPQARCLDCGQPVHASFAFCPRCGEEIRPASRRVALASAFRKLREQMPAGLTEKVLATRGRIEGERKQVTVLFCDLVSSATIAETMDPEDFRDLLDRYLAVVFDEVGRAEGLVNQIAGDGVMALFGAPLAHEDAPERAVQAAIAIRDSLVGLSDRLRAEGRPALQARFGLNTGPVIVGTVGGDLKLDYTAIGDTTNLAARLQSMARPGAILMSESTQRMVAPHFSARDLGPLAVRGKALPVRAFEVEGARASEPPLERRSARGGPFVGRTAELRRLEEAFARACGGRGQILGVVGHAGVGASRLIAEFVRRLDDGNALVLWGQCFSYARDAPYRPFVGLLRHHLAPGGTASDDAVAACLRSRVESLGSDTETTYEAVARVLGLVSTTASGTAGDELRVATAEAVARLILADCAKIPVVLVLEDAQWIDAASAELLEVFVERARGSCVMTVCSYRPDVPGPWSEALEGLEEIELAPLTPAETRSIVHAITGGDPPHELVEAIHERAEGNPFFTEEVTRDLLETGVVVVTSAGPVVARDLREVDVPATVHEIVAARLDRLPLESKRIVQVASVIGRRFSSSVLERLVAEEGIEVASRLAALAEDGVIRVARDGAAGEYLFEQALTQEVAYQGLLHKQRRELHREIGHALEGRSGTEPGESSALLAFHFQNAEQHEKAIQHLLAAAGHAESVPSYGSAAQFYRRAWDLARRDPADESQARRAIEAGIRLLGLAAIYGEGTESTAETVADGLADLLERAGTAEDRIAVANFTGLLRIMGAAEQHAAGLGQLGQAFELAQREGITYWRWRVQRGLAVGYALDGRFDDATRCADTALYEAIHANQAEENPDILLWARAARDVVLLHRDELEQGLAESLETHRLAVAHGNRSVQVTASAHIATALLLRGEVERAGEWAGEGLALAEAVGSRSGVPNLAALSVLAARRTGAAASGARLLRKIEDNLTGAAGVQQSLRFAVDAYLELGEIDRADRVAQRVRRRAGGRLRQAQSARALAAVALAQGEEGWRRAEYFYDEAVRVARDIGARTTLASALAGRAELEARRGNQRAARTSRSEAEKLAQSVGLRWLR